MTEDQAPGSPSGTIAVLLVVGAAAVLAGQIILQGYPDRPAYEFVIPTVFGLLLLGWASSDALLDRLPGERAASLRRSLDPRQSRLPLYIAGLVAAVVAAFLAGDEVLIHLPAVAIGFWMFGIAVVLWAASAFGRPSFRLSRWDLIFLIVLVAAAAIVRLIRLGEIPWLLAGDEASVGMSAREFLEGIWTNPFRVAWYSFPSLFFVVPAASIGLLGQTIEALRLPAAIAGILTVMALFFYARSTFGRTVAFLSAAYLAFFHFHIHFSRIALPNIWDALFFTLFSFFLWRAWSEEKPSLFAWAGIVAGLGQYFYTSTRYLLVLVPLWIIIAWASDRTKFRRIRKNWLILLAAALAVVLPLAIFFARHPSEFMAPMVRVSLLGQWLTNEVAATGLPAWRILAERIGLSAMAFSVANLRHWYRIEHPMLLPLPATLFLVGVGIALLRARDLRYSWLLMWMAIGVIAGGLSESTPAAQRYIFLAPAVSVLVALPLAELGRRFPQTTPRRRAILAAGAASILVIAAFLDLRFYFTDYTPSRVFSDTNTEVAQNLALFLLAEDLDQGAQVYFSGLPRMGYRSIETLPYLVPGDTFTDIVEPLTAPPTWAVQRPAAFVFLPENVGDLTWVEQAYAGGETIVRTAANGPDLYTIYILR
jgi:4-amino-4-deoxy-L-arabinose transferase-like glycosyltransferase